MIPDPPVRDDGHCAQCLGERKHAKWNRYAGDQAILDPFCASSCARVWHGNPLPPIAGIGLRRRAGA